MKRTQQLTVLIVPIVICTIMAFAEKSGVAQVVDGIGLNQVVVLEPESSDTRAAGFELTGENPVQVAFSATVHIHPLYYSRTEQIQGPTVAGGRHIIVVRHPISNQTCYVDVTLPRGAPEIKYEPKQLTYIYPDQRVQIRFTRSVLGGGFGAKIVYAKGEGWAAKAKNWHENTKENLKYQLSRSRLFNGAKAGVKETGKVVLGAAEATSIFGEQLTQKVAGILNGVPGISDLRSVAEQRFGNRERSANRFAEFQSRTKEAARSFSTNR